MSSVEVVTTNGSGRRLMSAQRRETIVDAAVKLLQTRGLAAVTMERIAEQAGINKALPYRHFANAEAVLVEVLARHMTLLGRRVLVAVEAQDSTETKMAAAATAYFDVVREHGSIMVLLLSAPSVDEESARQVGAGEFVEHLFVDHFEVPKRAVPAVFEVVLAILASCATSWQKRGANRRDLEALAVAAAMGAVTHAQRTHPARKRRVVRPSKH